MKAAGGTVAPGTYILVSAVVHGFTELRPRREFLVLLPDGTYASRIEVREGEKGKIPPPVQAGEYEVKPSFRTAS